MFLISNQKLFLFFEVFTFLEFQNVKFYEVVRCLSMKQEIYFTEKRGK